MDKKIPIFMNPDKTHPVGWVEISPDAEKVLTDGEHYIAHTLIDKPDNKRVVQLSIAVQGHSNGPAIKSNVPLYNRCEIHKYEGLISLLLINNTRLEYGVPEVLLTPDAAKRLLEQLHGILDKNKPE